MLSEKVVKGARALLRRRVARICRLLNLENDKAPTNVLAMEAKLIGDVAWLLAPESMADCLGTEKALKARRMFRVCVWDGECSEDATTDDGLCPAHAEQQAKEDAEEQAEVDDEVARIVAEQGEPGMTTLPPADNATGAVVDAMLAPYTRRSSDS